MVTPTPGRAWRSTGAQFEVPGVVDRMPEFDPRTGDHLWVVMPVYRVNPTQWADATHTPILDVENLVLVLPPGCFYCEQPYSERLALRRCKGRP